MKRKTIMRIEPKEPDKKLKKTGMVITAQEDGEILLLDYYQDGKWKKRHCLNMETKEYETYNVDSETWDRRNITAVYDTKPAYWRSGYMMDRDVNLHPKDRKLIQAALGTKSNGVFYYIENIENDRNREERNRKIERKQKRIEQLMESLPDLPMAIRIDWGWEVIGQRKHYAFFDKETGAWGRTCCKEPDGELERTDGGKKIRHNDEVRCSVCGALLTAKKRVDKIIKESRVMVLQRIDGEKSVSRHMKVVVHWNADGIHTYVGEEIRMILHHGTMPKCDIFYEQGSYWGWNGDWWTSNMANRRTGICLLYPYGIEDALKGTGYEQWAMLFGQMARENVYVDYNKLMQAGIGKDVVEYLFKGRFYRLLKETVDGIDYLGSYRGELDLYGMDEREVFQIRDRQKILRIRERDGGKRMVRWMRYSEGKREKISQDTLDWLEKNAIDPSRIEFIDGRMSTQQIMNYVEKQKKVSYPKLSAYQILEQWADYMSMCRLADKNIQDEMVYRPRELKRRHDELIVYKQKIQILADMERNPEANEKYANEMAGKYPGAEENLKAVREKYEYNNGQYRIIVPKRLLDIVKEGNALHHCAGATERYFERIMSRETYICFLRRMSEPDIPFYTIEIEPNGTIRQHRSYMDEEPGIEEIRGFLREWQKEVKKRIKKEDLELQKISAEKREKNLQELREKNNTRVLEGLMEDFMEAV